MLATVLASHFSPAITGAVLAGLATLLGGLTTLALATASARRAARARTAAESEKSLEDRLDELSKSMRISARLVEQVSAELDARAATAKRLKKEAKDAEALARLHKEQADAIRRMMDAELAASEHRIRRDSITIGIASFVFGGGLTLLVTLLVHPLH